MSEQTTIEEQQDVTQTDTLEDSVSNNDATPEAEVNGVDPEKEDTQDDAEQVEESAEPEENPNSEAAKYRHRLREAEAQLEEATALYDASVEQILSSAIDVRNPKAFWALYEGDKTDFMNEDGSVNRDKLTHASRELAARYDLEAGCIHGTMQLPLPEGKSLVDAVKSMASSEVKPLEQTGPATDRFADAFRPRTLPKPAPEVPEPQGKGGEAARYRRQLRATEAQLSDVQARHEGNIDTVIQSALPNGLEPRVFWALYEGDRTDFTTKDGTIDRVKVTSTARKVAKDAGLPLAAAYQPNGLWRDINPDGSARPGVRSYIVPNEGKMPDNSKHAVTFENAYAPQRE